MRCHIGFIALLALVACWGGAAVSAGQPAPAVNVAAGQSADPGRRAEPTLAQLMVRADSLIASRGGVSAENARLYLTWNAPYGMPGASRSRMPRSHNPLAVDTLWLSFLPGRTSAGFMACTAELDFRAAQGDTLGPWWQLEDRGLNQGELTAEFGPDPTFPQPQPWAVPAVGKALVLRDSTGLRVVVVVAVPYTQAVPINNPDSVYTLCRVLLHHRRTLPGCSQPVCVEWKKAALAYWLKDEPTVSRGERFVSYASDSSVCAGFVPAAAETRRTPAPVRPAPRKKLPRESRR